MNTNELLYELRESYDNPKKMGKLIFVMLFFLTFVVLSFILDQRLILFLEIPAFMIVRIVFFTKVLDERHLEIQRRSSFFSFNITIILGMIVGIFMMILYNTDKFLYTVGQAIIGFSMFQIIINSIFEAYYRSKMTEIEYAEQD